MRGTIRHFTLVNCPHLHIIDHPLVADMLAQARQRETPPAMFRSLLNRIGAILAYEAARIVPQVDATVLTPLELMHARRLKVPITIVPILRAGLGLAQGMFELMPESRMGHLGLFRNEETLEPVTYYENLPRDIAAGPVLLVDPMLATGGSACEGVRRLRARSCRDVRFLCLVAAPAGVEKLRSCDAEVPIFTAALDRELNDRGYILPGLGDAGDRLYGTG